MRAPALVGVIVALHLSVIGAFVFIQGCGTQQPKKPVEVSQPTPPVMPPQSSKSVRPVSPRPTFNPPVASTPEPVSFDPAKANTYVVQKGDSLSKIAKRNGTTAKELAAVNKISNPNKIRIGQKLILPPSAGSAPSASASSPKPSASSSSSMGGTYTIQKGDSLSKIAKKYGVSSKELAAANGITNPNKIRIGQKISVPEKGSTSSSSSRPAARPTAPAPVSSAPAIPSPLTSPAPAPAPAAPAPEVDDFSLGDWEYTLREGETIEQVAKDNGTTVEAILKLNGLATPADIGPGSSVKIPLPGE